MSHARTSRSPKPCPFAQDYYPYNPPGGKKVSTLTNQKEY